MLTVGLVSTGLVLGARHALEADHLAAVSALSVESTRRWQAFSVGALWGAGHAAVLLFIVGIGAWWVPPPSELATAYAECAVGGLLVALGLRTVLGASLGASPRPLSYSNREPHRGLTPLPRRDLRWQAVMQPVVVGMLHGLAGSGALVALAMLHAPAGWARIAFAALFGFGAMGGMAVLSGALGRVVGAATFLPRLSLGLRVVTALATVAVGLTWTSRAFTSLEVLKSGDHAVQAME